ncbi:hypothetical protein GGR57DRAFT_501206 [Xylariaceae sp. FL1272]|nr:hypothetical protein GGR57DRAFT_501206 [Xylariaceae sp. FL1272]
MFSLQLRRLFRFIPLIAILLPGTFAVDNQLLTELEVKSLVVKERYYRDYAQYTELREAWHPDTNKTHIQISWNNGTIDEYIAATKAMQSGSAISFHEIQPALVYLPSANSSYSWPAPLRAVTVSPCAIHIRFNYPTNSSDLSTTYDLTSYARLVSRVERVPASAVGEWKISTLEAIYVQDGIAAAFTGVGQSVALPIDPTARAAYRSISFVLGLSGHTVNQNLPGFDVPGSGEALIDGHLAWLDGDGS